MSEPAYVRQCGEVMSDDQALAWLEGALAEARAEGVTFARWSVHPDIPHLRLVEGWIERPQDQGDPRWALAACIAYDKQPEPKERPRKVGFYARRPR